MKNNIEVEVRSFISEKQYKELLSFFEKKGKFLKEDLQETIYFDCEEDLRIQKSKFFPKIWMKKGKMHDNQREEIEIKFNKKEFNKIKELFNSLGYNVQIKWIRKRIAFLWDDITVCLDYTKGYGYIIELEKVTIKANSKKDYLTLKEKLKSLDVKITTKKEFEEKFRYYKENWKNLIGE